VENQAVPYLGPARPHVLNPRLCHCNVIETSFILTEIKGFPCVPLIVLILIVVLLFGGGGLYFGAGAGAGWGQYHYGGSGIGLILIILLILFLVGR